MILFSTCRHKYEELGSSNCLLPLVFSCTVFHQQKITSFETTNSREMYHIYDVLEVQSHHEEAVSQNRRPDRLVFSQGELKLRRSGRAVSYESLVHPAMFSHPSPKSIGIIGSPEGGALREVLKHNTVKEVTMIGAEESIVGIAKTYLSDWNDCSTLSSTFAARSAFFCSDGQVVNEDGSGRIRLEASPGQTS